MKKKIISVALGGLMLISAGGLVGCEGGSETANNTVVIYKEYNGAIGSEDNVVKEAIEKKFKEDTGLEIDLQVEAAGTDMLGSKVVGAMANQADQIDAVIGHYGGDGPIDSYILDGLTIDLTESVKTYAPSFYENFNETTDPGGKSYGSGVMNGKLYALSDKTRTSGWGMIIRKDYMEKTSFDPDKYDILQEDHVSLSIDDFKRLLVELKQNTDAERPVVGAPWSLDYFLAAPFGAVSYGGKVLDENGNLIPAYADETYCNVLELYRWLQEEKLWIENPANAQNGLNYFVSGKGAIYMDWPEVTSQIDVARSLKEATGADCIFIEPLLKVGSETETNGNLAINSAFSGLIMPLKTKNSQLLLQYINWLYSDVENYELAKYGVEGVHWVASEDGKYWSYPEAKKAQYEKSIPYSGKYCLLSDHTFSERLYAGYTETENEIIEKVRAFPSYPADGMVTGGMLLPSVPGTDRKLRNIETAHFNEYTSVRAYAWSDAALPTGKTIRSMWQEMHDNLYDESKYFPLITYNTEVYNKAKSN